MRNQVYCPHPGPFLTLAPTPQYYFLEMATPRRSLSPTDDCCGGGARTHAEHLAGPEDILYGDSQMFLVTDEFRQPRRCGLSRNK